MVHLDVTELGKELKYIRKELNLTIEEASFHAGINEKTIYRIEHGKNKISNNTLDKLSLVYKKDLFEIQSKYVSNPREILFKIILNAERSLYNDNIEDIELNIKKLEKLNSNLLNSYERLYVKHYIGLLEATCIDLKDNSRRDAINHLIRSIKTDIVDFKLNNYKDFNYSIMEKRILMNVSTMGYGLYEDKRFFYILDHLIKLLKDDQILFPKLILNLSTIYQKQREHKKSLYYTNEGITYCIKNNSMEVLPKLFFRKFTLELYMNLDNYTESLEKAIFLAEINNQEYLKNIFKRSAEKIYGVSLYN